MKLDEFEDFCEGKALDGDSSFAVAYALLKLGDAVKNQRGDIAEGLAGIASSLSALSENVEAIQNIAAMIYLSKPTNPRVRR
jgi:hypothetical protein